ncbi:hypothetical protein DL96DRAFT_1624375 [Flagelloscypha sp. PMI_526]|nr:hypothetical protein DL96DRAFT_1624375 [Flagelloscypha sp. PMI_526]
MSSLLDTLPLSLNSDIDDLQSIEDLDREIEHHVQELQRLRAERNQRESPTQQLPSEILAEIFLIYRDLALSDYIATSSNTMYGWQASQARQVHPVPWLLPSLICRHWRSVALDFPSFWAVLFLNNLRWTEELLLRSKGAPLHIQPRSYPSGSFQFSRIHPIPPSLKLALAESSRIETLYLDISQLGLSRPDEKAVTKALSKTSFPRLRSVRFASGGWIIDPHSPGGYVSRKFVDKVARKALPTLRFLEITGRPPGPICSTLSSNTLTRLECNNIAPTERPTVSFFLQMLHRLPALQELNLNGAINSENPGVPLTKVQHSSLRSLTLYSTDTPLVVFANLLEHLEVRLDISLVVGGHCSGVLPVSPTYFPTGAPPGPTVHNPRDDLRVFFSVMTPYLTSIRPNAKGKSKSAGQSFRSSLVETNSSYMTVAFSRGRNITIQKDPPLPPGMIAPHLGNWKGDSYTNVDVRLDLHGLHYVHPHVVPIPMATGQPDVTPLPPADPTAVILEYTHDIFEQSEHVYISEAWHGAGWGSQFPESWLAALSKSTYLKDLDMRVSNWSLPLFGRMLGMESAQNSNDTEFVEEDELTFPALETITRWEVTVALPPATPYVPYMPTPYPGYVPEGPGTTSTPSSRSSPQLPPQPLMPLPPPQPLFPVQQSNSRPLPPVPLNPNTVEMPSPSSVKIGTLEDAVDGNDQPSTPLEVVEGAGDGDDNPTPSSPDDVQHPASINPPAPVLNTTGPAWTPLIVQGTGSDNVTPPDTPNPPFQAANYMGPPGFQATPYVPFPPGYPAGVVSSPWQHTPHIPLPQSYEANFVKALGRRKAIGRPLARLYFRRCYDLPDNFLDEYREVVDEVHWDGVTVVDPNAQTWGGGQTQPWVPPPQWPGNIDESDSENND